MSHLKFKHQHVAYTNMFSFYTVFNYFVILSVTASVLLIHSRIIRRGSALLDDQDNLINANKSQTDDLLLKLCKKYQPPNGISIGLEGKISVIVRLKLWPSIGRQAFLLSKLDGRFRIIGFRNIQFIIASPSDLETPGQLNVDNINQSNNDTHNIFSNYSKPNETVQQKLNVTYRTMNKYNATLIIGSTSDSFSEFDELSANVFDQCGRLAYTIYHPWSSLQRPYIKGAILSTIYDEPCGECNVSRMWLHYCFLLSLTYIMKCK